MGDTDMVDKFVSYLESYTSLKLIHMGEINDGKEYLDHFEIKTTSFKLAKQNAIDLLENEIKRIQQNLDHIKIMTLENWNKHSWSYEEEQNFSEATKQ